MQTSVVNIRFESYDVYCGRPGKGQSGYFGNPYKTGDREADIEQFSAYFHDRIVKEPEFKSNVLKLRGKKLGCFCSPQNCHANIIADYLNSLSLKFAIIGSREFSDYQFLKECLAKHSVGEIVSGGAKGADALAKQYAMEHNIAYTEFPAQWDLFGKSAGIRRNVDIINLSDEVVAFWNGASPGTKHAISIAKKAEKHVHIYWPEEIDEMAQLG